MRRADSPEIGAGAVISAIAGPDMVVLRGSRHPHAVGTRHEDEFDVYHRGGCLASPAAQRRNISADDPRFLGTVGAVENELLRDGLVLRYRTDAGLDGLPGDEHPFLACSFWLVTAYAMTGRLEDGHTLMRRLVALANDVGLLSEEYDPIEDRMVGNFPQAFSHLALIGAAHALEDATTALLEEATSERTADG